MQPNQIPQIPQGGAPTGGQQTPGMQPPLPGPAPVPGQSIAPITAPAPQTSAAPAAQQDAPVKRNPNSTQNSLLLSEIRDNLAIMNDGSMRAVVSCRSINFDLMSAREREGVEYSYQNFLNSLYFPVQIFIRSQRVDIGPYLDRLIKLRREQDNMLLGVLMEDYIDFISALSQEANIMDKSFFIVVPYYPAGNVDSAVNTSRNFLANLFSPQTQQRVRIDEVTFNKAKDELRNRVQTVMNGLLQIGVRSAQLSTKELGELYYNVYNPDTAVRQPLGNFEDLNAPVITKGQGQASQPHLDREMS
jgi:type IV secretory pathway VirB4 component